MPRLFWRRLATPASNEDPHQPLLLTVDEACRALRVSRWTVNQLIRTRKLTTIKIGSRRLVPATAIHTFVQSRTDEANS
ncbi:helix-turn-helix domain-containing protein [Amycolatopsis heterodermiae]|uniref:helix-turn-helix domain-containing protein n=1 Tax=Amycolatopsis heterodermiae TaxID=3110235 RepID=UPI003969FEA3